MDTDENDLGFGDGDDGEEVVLNEEDIVQVIDLQDLQEGDLGSDEEMDGAEEPPVEDKAAVVFNAHSEKPQAEDEPPEVYAVHIDPSNSGMVVTGGRDDAAYVWVLNSGKVLFECTGHKNSVTCVSFCHDGKYVASADLDGLIKVWRVETKEEVWSYECGSDITWLQWHPAAHALVAGTQSGEVWMWKVPSSDWSKMKMFQSHGHPSLCGKILADGNSVCVGYADGGVKLWDLKSGKNVHSWQHASLPEEEKEEEMAKDESEDEDGQAEAAEKPPAEEEVEEEEAEEAVPVTSPVAILCIDSSADSSLLMSGCADSTAKIYSVSSGKLVSTFGCAVNKEQDISVESVAFCPSAPYVATATYSGAVEIWDIPSSVVRQTLRHPEGVSRVKWSASSLLLYTAGFDGVTRVWDARNGASKAELTGHSRGACVLDLDASRDGTCLVSTSEDGTARVFDLRFMQS